MKKESETILTPIRLQICLALIIVAFVWSRGYELFLTWGPSMEPTLKTGDLVIVNKIFYDYTAIDRLDVVVLKDVEDGGYMIKRIIGLPMEIIEIKRGIVFIHGKKTKLDYKANTEKLYVEPIKVPAGHYFYIGDNFEWSTWGIIRERDIVGKANKK